MIRNKYHPWKVGSIKILMYYFNSKTTYPIPWAFDFFEKFWSNFLVCWQFSWSNAPLARASKSIRSPTHQVVIKATFQKISHASNHLFKCKYPTKRGRKSQSLFQKAHILQAGGTSFSVKFPTVWSLTPVKFPGYMGLGEGGMDGNVWNWLVHNFDVEAQELAHPPYKIL